MNIETLKDSLKDLKYGDIRIVAMTERGAYTEETMPGKHAEEQQATSHLLIDLVNEIRSTDEDLTVIKRSDEDSALTEAELESVLSEMNNKKHIIFVECLFMGTSEIKNILNLLLKKKLPADSKLILLDLPQLEYMMLRDSFSGQLQL